MCVHVRRLSNVYYHMYLSLFTCMEEYVNICEYVYAYVKGNVYAYCTYLYMYTCIRICTCMYI